jgi:hypothetical protein
VFTGFSASSEVGLASLLAHYPVALQLAD